MTGLSATETHALAYIEAVLVRTGGTSPTIREISKAVGINSNGETHTIVKWLESESYIRRMTPAYPGSRAKERSIEVLRPVIAPRINGEPLPFIAVDELPSKNRPTISLSESPTRQGRTAPHAAKDRHGVQPCAPHFEKEI